MKIRMHMLLGLAAFFALVLSMIPGAYVGAEGQENATDNMSKGLTVSPSIDKLGEIKPGETYIREFTAVNSGDKTIAFKVQTSSFWVEDEEYEMKWGASDSQYGKIAGWTDIDSARVHEVKAGETYKFKYRITVPEDQAGGTQRLMVTFSLGSTGDGGFIETELNLNTLIFATVEGDINPSAKIVSHNIQGFSFNPSVNSSSVLKNTGNVDLDVSYKMYATSFFSGEQAFLLNEDKVLMTESSRFFEQTWTNTPYLGIFNVTQEITILGEVHVFTSVAVICPLWLIIAAILTIIILVILIIHRKKRDKRKSKN